nr:thioredoxin domain-containing protein [Gammaproteobacteria bacterium]
QQNASMRKALESIFGEPPAGEPLGEAALNLARLQLEQSFGARDGGFGGAPKFPHPTNIERLLRHWAASRDNPDRQALHMAVFSLQKMAQGGIYDHLGGGFCRYSVDGQWMIPHFEKMLYDNGPLLGLCAQAAVATVDAELERTARETAGWAMREMQSPEGGYYSSLDADAEGEEGKFHVWDRAQIEALLEPRDYAIFARRFGLDGPANFEGRWHLRVCADLNDLAAAFDTDEHTISISLAKSRQTLFDVREVRVHPGRDDKVLTSWNALMIKGMATAGRHLEMPECIASAQRSLDFVRQTLWRDGRLLATFKDGKAHLTAYVDDYAFLIDAVLELLQARWRGDELTFACELADALIEHFEDRESGGFYFTADDHEPLIQRPKVLADEATPAGNGVAAQALSRLGFLVGDTRYIEAAERTLKVAAGAVAQAPIAHASLLAALEERITPPQILILRGAGETFESWQRAAARAYAPRRLVFAIPTDARDLPPALAEKTSDGATVVYLCEGMTCAAPITDTENFEKMLGATDASS